MLSNVKSASIFSLTKLSVFLIFSYFVPSISGAAVSCTTSLVKTEVISEADDIANDPLVNDTIRKLDQLIELSKTELVDFEVTDLLAGPVFSLQNEFNDTFRRYNDVLENVLPGLHGKQSLDIAVELTNDLELLTNLTAKDRDFLTRLKVLIPGMIGRQKRSAESRVQINHQKAIELFTEIRNDNDLLKAFEKEIRVLKQTVEEQIQIQKGLKDYFQKTIWSLEEDGERGQLNMLKEAAIQIDQNLSSLGDTLAVVSGLQNKIESTSKNNLTAFRKLSQVVQKDLPQLKALMGNTGLNLEPRSEQSRSTISAVKKSPTGSSVKERMDAFNSKFENIRGETYANYLNREVNRWDNISVNDFIYVMENAAWKTDFDIDDTVGSTYKAFPLSPIPPLLRKESLKIALPLAPARIPLLMGMRLFLGERYHFTKGQLIILKLIRKIDLTQISREDFKNLKAFLSSRNERGIFKVYYNTSPFDYNTTDYFYKQVLPSLEVKMAKIWSKE